MLNLQNEADLSGCYGFRISLRDKRLEIQVRQFFNWLRLSKNGFVWGAVCAVRTHSARLVGLGLGAKRR